MLTNEIIFWYMPDIYPMTEICLHQAAQQMRLMIAQQLPDD